MFFIFNPSHFSFDKSKSSSSWFLIICKMSDCNFQICSNLSFIFRKKKIEKKNQIKFFLFQKSSFSSNNKMFLVDLCCSCCSCWRRRISKKDWKLFFSELFCWIICKFELIIDISRREYAINSRKCWWRKIENIFFEN